MARISGVDLPDQKKVEIGLTYIYGIGRANVLELMKKANIAPGKRIKELNEDELSRIQKALDGFTVEGDLRREIAQNIRRLEDIGAYRGIRHRRGLPGRGRYGSKRCGRKDR
jgi:small subunit ribosomal protein S13